jgi:hypothetical protein
MPFPFYSRATFAGESAAVMAGKTFNKQIRRRENDDRARNDAGCVGERFRRFLKTN